MLFVQWTYFVQFVIYIFVMRHIFHFNSFHLDYSTDTFVILIVMHIFSAIFSIADDYYYERLKSIQITSIRSVIVIGF